MASVGGLSVSGLDARTQNTTTDRPSRSETEDNTEAFEETAATEDTADELAQGIADQIMTKMSQEDRKHRRYR